MVLSSGDDVKAADFLNSQTQYKTLKHSSFVVKVGRISSICECIDIYTHTWFDAEKERQEASRECRLAECAQEPQRHRNAKFIWHATDRW